MTSPRQPLAQPGPNPTQPNPVTHASSRGTLDDDSRATPNAPIITSPSPTFSFKVHTSPTVDLMIPSSRLVTIHEATELIKKLKEFDHCSRAPAQHSHLALNSTRPEPSISAAALGTGCRGRIRDFFFIFLQNSDSKYKMKLLRSHARRSSSAGPLLTSPTTRTPCPNQLLTVDGS